MVVANKLAQMKHVQIIQLFKSSSCFVIICDCDVFFFKSRLVNIDFHLIGGLIPYRSVGGIFNSMSHLFSFSAYAALPPYDGLRIKTKLRGFCSPIEIVVSDSKRWDVSNWVLYFCLSYISTNCEEKTSIYALFVVRVCVRFFSFIVRLLKIS